jgi:hypothetical protein
MPTKIDAIAELARSNRITHHVDSIEEIKVMPDGLYLGSHVYPMINTESIARSAGVKAAIACSREPLLLSLAMHLALKIHGDKSAELIMENGRVLGLRIEGLPHVSTAEILLCDNIPDDSQVTLTQTGAIIRIQTPMLFEASVGDPVRIDTIIRNDEFGPFLGVQFETALLRLVCENGATIQSRMFAQRLSPRSIDDMDGAFSSFNQAITERHRRLSIAAPRMVATRLGDSAASIRQRQKQLAGRTSFPPYTANDSFWEAFNSITECAKVAAKRRELECWAGSMIGHFANG